MQHKEGKIKYLIILEYSLVTLRKIFFEPYFLVLTMVFGKCMYVYRVFITLVFVDMNSALRTWQHTFLHITSEMILAQENRRENTLYYIDHLLDIYLFITLNSRW